MRLYSISWLIAAVLASLLLTVSGHTQTRTDFGQVIVYGQGPDIILIPGLGCSGEVWKTTVGQIEKTNTCHVVTLAGFAGVPAVSGDFLAPRRDALVAYIRKNCKTKPIVIGHSLGGFLGLMIASEYPDVIGKLIVVDAVPFLPALANPAATVELAKPQAAMMERMLLNQDAVNFAQSQYATIRTMVSDSTQSRTVAEWSIASDRTSLTAAMREMMTTDYRKNISTIRVPTLVLGSWGGYKVFGMTSDMVLGLFQQNYAALPSVTIHMAPTARHFIMLDEPTWFFSEVHSFLKTN